MPNRRNYSRSCRDRIICSRYAPGFPHGGYRFFPNSLGNNLILPITSLRSIFSRTVQEGSAEINRFIFPLFHFHHRYGSALFYRLAVVDDRRGIKKQRIVRFRKVDQPSESGRRDISDIDKRNFGIACCKKRCYTAAERISENNKPAFLRGIRIGNSDDRARAAEEHFIRISACGSAEIINGNVRRRFGVIHFKVPYHGVIEIEKPLRCVREGRLTVIDAVKRNTRVILRPTPRFNAVVDLPVPPF